MLSVRELPGLGGAGLAELACCIRLARSEVRFLADQANFSQTKEFNTAGFFIKMPMGTKADHSILNMPLSQ